MSRPFREALSHGGAGLRGRVLALYAVLAAFNLSAWAWALIAFSAHPVLLATALLAYGFGLRHAVDADHIAAIDNVTRKLMQEGKRPVAVGFFFALGHSTVVVLAAIVAALAAGALNERFAAFKDTGALIGTSISASFLFAIAIVNLFIFVGVWRTFARVRAGGELVEEDLDLLLSGRGLLARLFRPLFRFIGKSWHLFPLGFLFGLGFDTATEIGLLGISAAEAAKGLSLWSIMVFPALFTAGMTLVDTTDGVVMLGAYGWAFLKPIRKLYYNLTITAVSVLVAFFVGGVEALGLVADKLELSGAFWQAVAAVNEDFGTLGYVIIALFVLAWAASVVVYRVKGYDRLELRASERDSGAG